MCLSCLNFTYKRFLGPSIVYPGQSKYLLLARSSVVVIFFRLFLLRLTIMNGHVEPYFKVIIIGAGVGGLTLAHSLHKADIDYVILDKHPVAPEWGASITIHTQSARILDQLGLLPAVEAQCAEMRKFWHRDQDGKCYLAQDFIHFVNRR